MDFKFESISSRNAKSSVQIKNDVIKQDSLSDNNRWKQMIARTIYYIVPKYCVATKIVIILSISMACQGSLKTTYHLMEYRHRNGAELGTSIGTLNIPSWEAIISAK